MMSLDQHDTESLWRCPMLGGPVPFKHCRRTNNTLPCPRIGDCWASRLDVEAFLTKNYSKEELEKVYSPAPSRMDRIMKTVNLFAPESKSDQS